MPEPTPEEEARIRLALTMIGDEAHRTLPEPQQQRLQAPWWRRNRLGAGLALAAAATVVVLALTFSLAGSGGDSSNEAGSGADDDRTGRLQTSQEGIACARIIAEVDVLAVRKAPQKGRVDVSFAVRDWIKPEHGKSRIDLNLVDPSVAKVYEPWRAGQHLLIIVPIRKDLEAAPYSGDSIAPQRQNIEHYLPQAQKIECPARWRNPPN